MPHFLITELIALALAGVVLIHASFRLIKTFRNVQFTRDPRWLFDVAWFLVAVGLLYLWPEALDFSLYPRRALVFWGAIAVLPITISSELPRDSRYYRAFRSVAVVLSVAGISFCLLRAVQYLLFVRVWMEGPDFYYYVCTARHMASQIGGISIIRYFYFPGVYSFWRVVLHFTDSSLDGLQWWYFAVLAGNALLIAAVVQRVTRNIYASVMSLVWYVAFCSLFEGLQGTTEPISTLPMLAGLLIWSGRPLTGRTGTWRAVGLGIAMGLGVYTRQQAGLVSLGAITLLLTHLIQPKENRIVNWSALLLIPAVAFLLLLIGILLEGYGLQPLMVGIENMAGYGAKWSFWYMIRLSFHLVMPLFLCSILGLLMYLAVIMISRFRASLVEPEWQVLGFSVLAGFLSLIPFFSRPHLHYALIGGPMLIIASAISIVIIARVVPVSWKRTPFARFALLILLILPFVHLKVRSAGFYLWPYDRYIRYPQSRPWRLTPGLAEDIAKMKQHVRPMENIYVLPPRQNDLHFFLGTRYEQYGWGTPIALNDVLAGAGLEGVLIVNVDSLPDYVALASKRAFDYDDAEQILTEHSYRLVVKLPTMSLWRK